MLNQPKTGQWRVPVVRPCQLVAEGATLEGEIRNLSVGGAYVGLAPPPAPGETLWISFALPDDGTLIEAAVEVAWRNTLRTRKVETLPEGCGLRFLTLPDAYRKRIEWFVYKESQGRDQ